jgi:predicted Zn-dependent peptidase
MKKFLSLLNVALLLLLVACTPKEKYQRSTHTDANGYTYESYSDDPLNARIYTLDNGLKVFLSVNQDEPRLATLIGVRAGAAHDPLETTGLAHYFEHMMFKGTDEIGTSDWEAESALLEQISERFEAHRAATDSAEKFAIYLEIDSLSTEASKYAIPNEYDKMVSTLGAKNTNAGTSLDYTVYINDIPANALEKWAMLESERFNDIVLRLFHTELETVYEEFNMYQDMDRTRANAAMMAALFPNHPYGRAIIGLPEHLKNPSMVKIYEFAQTYYVPNNMTVAIAGDLDFEETIKVIDRYFGPMAAGELPETQTINEEALTEAKAVDVYGRDAESVQMSFRYAGVGSHDHLMVSLIDKILSNSKAGLIDLNLNQEQKVLNAGSYAYFLKDYGMHSFYGRPRQGQSLEEVKDLLLAEVEKVKKGEFDDWLLEAIINDMRLREIRRMESNFSRVFSYVNGFTTHQEYSEQLSFIDNMEKITKEEVMQYANENYGENYVVVYKRTGEPQRIVKVEKPPITPIEINRDEKSEFFVRFEEMKTEDLEPVFVDYPASIYTSSLDNGLEFNYIENKTNELFNLQYILDMGSDNDLLLPLAVNYLPYLGTEKYTAAELQQEMFRLGLTMDVSTGNDRCYVYITGLESSLEEGVDLLEHILSSVQPDEDAFRDYVDGILKKRMDSKLDKDAILWRALFNYGKYGAENPFTHILPEDSLRALDPSKLTEVLRQLTSYKHRIFYYGKKSPDEVSSLLLAKHNVPETLLDYPPAKNFPFQNTDQDLVYFVEYDMVQANILMLAKGPEFDASLIPAAQLFGEYFGSGLSSIVFQEIRESKALAYAAFSAFSIPQKKEDPFYLYGFVGTQGDKLNIATDALMELMNEMPRAQQQYDLARESIMKKIETERIIKTRIFWTWQRLQDQGIDYDIRRDVYAQMQEMSLDEFEAFFNQYIAGNSYIYLIMGKKENLDMNILAQMGTLKELSLEEIFNY